MNSIISDEAWYGTATRLADRAEDLANPTATYVDTVFLTALQNRRNQIVFGRRGTGKTHLLRRLQDELFERFDDLKLVPVYIDGATLEGSISLHSDPAAVALALYVELLRRTVSNLSQFIHGKIRPGIIDRLFSGPKQDLLSRARDTVGRLDLLLAQGKVRMLPIGDASAEFEDLDEAVSKRRLAAGAKASISLSDPRALGLKLDASAEKEFKKTAKAMTTRKIGGETYLPLADVAELIRQLLETLGDANLMILVDEWSSLGDADVQPLLAQLLRLTARGRICIKLACVPGRTELYLASATRDGRNPIGLELGDDITADVNLDSVVFVDNDIRQLATFFISLIQRHMGVEIPELANMSIESFSKHILTDRMEGPSILGELCHASGAVPRDFINTFRQATVAQRAAGADKMAVAHVRSAALNIYEGKRSNLATSKPGELLLLDRIYRKVVIGQKTYFFLVEASLVEHDKIVELFTSRLIHRTPATWLDPDSMVSYVYYMIDYGTSIELLRQAGVKVWDKLTRGSRKIVVIKWLDIKLDLNDEYMKKALDNLVITFEATRLDADPHSLIIDLEMIEGGGT
jgi:Cdc6-like AAA superfamily ATPase